MADKIIIRHGQLADLPTLDRAELGFVEDDRTLYMGTQSDGNILLNPVTVELDGYTIGADFYPQTDIKFNLGTATNRWAGVSVGPGSLHIVAKNTDVGFSNNYDFKIGIDSISGNLQIVGNNNVLFEANATTGVSIPGFNVDLTSIYVALDGYQTQLDQKTSDTAFQEHANQQNQVNQSILQSLDGYQTQLNSTVSDTTFQENKTQQAQINQSILQSLDGYQLEISGLDINFQEHSNQQNQINQTILQSLDGYQTQLNGAETTFQQHANQQNQVNQSILQSLDGYQTQINLTVSETTFQEHSNQQNQINQSILQNLDGYQTQLNLTVSETTFQQHANQQNQVNQSILQSLDGYQTQINSTVSETTFQEHSNQQNQINQSILETLDGYGTLPSGTIQAFAGASTPTGWLDCDGSAVNRTTFAALFAALSTTWGVGDGSTTFNVPDLRGRALIGAGAGSGLTARTLGTQNIGEETHQLTTAELASHSHGLTNLKSDAGIKLTSGTPSDTVVTLTTGTAMTATLTDTQGSGTAHNNMQPSAVIKWIIKT